MFWNLPLGMKRKMTTILIYLAAALTLVKSIIISVSFRIYKLKDISSTARAMEVGPKISQF